MKTQLHATLVLAGLLSIACGGGNAPPVSAPNPSTHITQDRFLDIQYLAGHAGFGKKLDGRLVLTDSGVLFTKRDKRDTPVFFIPLTSIVEVTSAVDRKEASVGSKIMFGFLAKSRKEELVQVATEGPAGAEGIVFKVRKNESLGIVAKIRYRMKALLETGTVPRQAAATAGSVNSPLAEAALSAALIDTVPAGINWIANRGTRIYFQVGCVAAARIASADRLFYATETAALGAGFTRSEEC